MSCNIPNVGAAGNEQAHNGLCVLTQVFSFLCFVLNSSDLSLQNIINEKIYLFLWFWFMFLFTVSIFFVFYRWASDPSDPQNVNLEIPRICTLFFEKLRFQLLFKTVG